MSQVHVWEITSGFPSLSAHVLVDNDCNCHEFARTLKQLLRESFDIDHATLQADHESVELLSIESRTVRAVTQLAGRGHLGRSCQRRGRSWLTDHRVVHPGQPDERPLRLGVTTW